MAVKKVIFRIGQSNEEGFGDKENLPSSLRNVQSNRWTFNVRTNSTIVAAYPHFQPEFQLMNVDGTGSYTPNTSTGLLADTCGPNLSYMEAWLEAEEAIAGVGAVDIFEFKYAKPNTSMGPRSIGGKPNAVWNVESGGGSDPDYSDSGVGVSTSDTCYSSKVGWKGLWTELKYRWELFRTTFATEYPSDTIEVQGILWTQGEGDYLVDGNDLTYYGHCVRFKKEVRNLVFPDTGGKFATADEIPWVSALMFFNPETGSNYQRQQNLRSAIRRSGWGDKAFRVVDFRNLSVGQDKFHLDTAGVVAYGKAQFEAIQNIKKNNSMAFEEYNLNSLRERLREEFGVDDTAANNEIIDKRINDAQAWVVNRRKNWPFMERLKSIDFGEWTESTTAVTRRGAAIFQKGVEVIQEAILRDGNVVLDPLIPNEFLVVSGETSAFRLTGTSGTGASLDRRFTLPSQICTISNITAANPAVVTFNTTSVYGNKVTLPTNPEFFPVSIRDVSSPGSYGNPDEISRSTPLTPVVHWAKRLTDNTFELYAPGGVVTRNNSASASAGTGGTVSIGRPFTVEQAIFELPSDFIRMLTVYEEGDDEPIRYLIPEKFERLIREDNTSTGSRSNDKFYTVVPDPSFTESGKRYLWIYPRKDDTGILKIKYYGDVKKLVGDLDVSLIPKSDGFVLWYASAWFVAQWLKETELVSFYRDGAMNELERMAKEYQLSDDITETQPSVYYDYEGGRPPDGYPSFDFD